MITITSQNWTQGIGDNQYAGLANIRNLRIDDIGTLRLHPRPSKVADTPGDVIRIDHSYLDIREDWYATIGQVVREAENVGSIDIGGSAIYQSITGSYITLPKQLSGSVVWRDYMFTFNKTPNVDSDLLVDTDSNGTFNQILNDWEVLTTEGQTQSRFNQVSSEFTIANNGAVLLGSTHVAVIVLNEIRVYEISGSSFLQVASINADADAIAGFDNTAFATIESTTGDITRYEFDGVDTITEISSQPAIPLDSTYVSMSRMDNDTVCAVYHNGTNISAPEWQPTRSYSIGDTASFEGIIYEAEDDIEGDVNNQPPNIDTSNWDVLNIPTFSMRFSSFEWNGVGFSEVTRTVNGASDIFDPFIVGLTANRAIVMASVFGSPTLFAYERSITWDEEDTLDLISFGISINEVGPLVRSDANNFIMAGNSRISFNYDNVTNELSIVDNNIVGFTDIKQTGDQVSDLYLFTENLNIQTFTFDERVINSTPAVVGLDDGVYWANGSNVASLIEVAGTTFDPNNSGTYIINHSALDLPPNTVITSIGEVGQFLAIGTMSGLLYFWDRISDSFRIPVIIGEEIAVINSKNNVTYTVTNNAGNVYLSDFSSYQKSKSLSSLTHIRFRNDIKNNATEIFDDGFYVGASVSNNDLRYTGIWIFRNGAWTIVTSSLEEQPLALSKFSPSQMAIGTSTQLEVVDIAGVTTAEWTGDQAYITSPMILTGEVAKKSQATKYSVYFEKQMESSDYFAIQYRTTTNAPFIEIERRTGAELGTVTGSGLYAYTGSFSSVQTEQMQVRLVINTVAGFVKLDII